jgi:branched-chain amino acid aminotransferase
MTNEVMLHSGRLVFKNNEILNLSNRAFRFGDALFETMLVFAGTPVWFAAHRARMQAGARVLGFDEAAVANRLEQLADDLAAAWQQAGRPDWARLRYTLFREGGGAYTPATDTVGDQLLLKPTSAGPPRQPAGHTAGFFEQIPVPNSQLARYKTANRLPNVLAARAAQQAGWGIALMLGEGGQLVCSAAGNLVLRSGRQLITPPLSDGCLDGITRKWVIGQAPELGLEPLEQTLMPAALASADELWSVNSIQGIVPVTQLLGQAPRQFGKDLARDLQERFLGGVESHNFTSP